MDFLFAQNFLTDWILSKGLRVVGILLGAFVLNFVVRALIIKGFQKRIGNGFNGKKKKRVETLISIFKGTSGFVISILVILIILPEFGVNISALLAGVGVLGLAVGMASREIIADFLSGIFILIEDQFNVGDTVKIMGIEGEIKEITLRKTMILDEAGNMHLIPNGQIKVVAKKHK